MASASICLRSKRSWVRVPPCAPVIQGSAAFRVTTGVTDGRKRKGRLADRPRGGRRDQLAEVRLDLCGPLAGVDPVALKESPRGGGAADAPGRRSPCRCCRSGWRAGRRRSRMASRSPTGPPRSGPDRLGGIILRGVLEPAGHATSSGLSIHSAMSRIFLLWRFCTSQTFTWYGSPVFPGSRPTRRPRVRRAPTRRRTAAS
jgi:hypothetical protein